jgi:hypothetical protein
VATARTRAARHLDPDDPAVERAIQRAIDQRLEIALSSGYRTWCSDARLRLDRALD